MNAVSMVAAGARAVHARARQQLADPRARRLRQRAQERLAQIGLDILIVLIALEIQHAHAGLGAQRLDSSARPRGADQVDPRRQILRVGQHADDIAILAAIPIPGAVERIDHNHQLGIAALSAVLLVVGAQRLAHQLAKRLARVHAADVERQHLDIGFAAGLADIRAGLDGDLLVAHGLRKRVRLAELLVELLGDRAAKLERVVVAAEAAEVRQEGVRGGALLAHQLRRQRGFADPRRADQHQHAVLDRQKLLDLSAHKLAPDELALVGPQQLIVDRLKQLAQRGRANQRLSKRSRR